MARKRPGKRERQACNAHTAFARYREELVQLNMSAPKPETLDPKIWGRAKANQVIGAIGSSASRESWSGPRQGGYAGARNPLRDTISKRIKGKGGVLAHSRSRLP